MTGVAGRTKVHFRELNGSLGGMENVDSVVDELEISL